MVNTDWFCSDGKQSVSSVFATGDKTVYEAVNETAWIRERAEAFFRLYIGPSVRMKPSSE